MARYLPADCLAIMEVRLAPGCEAVDFSLRLAEPAQARRIAGHLPAPHLRSILSLWSQRVDWLAPVSSLWLEFDLGPPIREGVGLPLPILCAQLGERVEADWLSETLLPALHGRPLSAAQRRLIRRCMAALPVDGKVLYAFSLQPRPGDRVRLELGGLDLPAMVEYLQRVASPAAAKQVAACAPLVADCQRPHLSFDLGVEVSTRIGIEGSFVRLPHREPRWAGLFDRLVASGLCTPEKRDAIFAWTGYDSLWTAADRWPEEAVALGGYCVRGLSHVKLVSWPEREPEAKAYLVFQHLRRSRDGSDPPQIRLR